MKEKSFEEDFPSLMKGFTKAFKPFTLVEQDWIKEGCLDKERVKEVIHRFVMTITPMMMEELGRTGDSLQLLFSRELKKQLYKELNLK